MCDECDCEPSVEHGLKMIAEAIRNDISNKYSWWYYKHFIQPRRNRELMHEYGTLHPTWEQVLAKHPGRLVPIYIDAQLIELLKKETPVMHLLPVKSAAAICRRAMNKSRKSKRSKKRVRPHKR